MRISSLVERYRQGHLTTMKPETQESYRRSLDEVNAILGNMNAVELKPANVMAYLDGHPQWNQSTRALHLAHMRSMFRWGFQNYLIATNPMERLGRMPSFKRRGWECIPTKEEYESLLGAAHPVFKPVLIFWWETGTRPNDVTKITVEGVDWENCSWTQPKHKTDKHGHKYVVTFSSKCMDLLLALRERRGSGHLFRNYAGKALVWKCIRYYWWTCRQKANCRPSVIPYGFRHALACSLLQAGVNIGDIAAIMGHSNTLTVQQRYLHLIQNTSKFRGILDGR